MSLHARWVGVLFGIGILSLAVVAAARALPYRAQPGASLIRGEIAKQFEAHYDKLFPVKTLGTNVWAAIQLTLFGEGRSGVVIGEDGWLYTQEEFRDYTDGEQRIAAHLRLIEQVRDALRARHTELVVALVPAKARIYPEHLGGERPAAVHRDLYLQVQMELAQRQIAAPDLLRAFAHCKTGQAVFLRTDTHWTPDGAACAARAIVQATGADGAQRFDTEFEAPREHRGDLMQFLPLTPYFDTLLPEPDLLVPRVTVAQGAGTLLDELPVPDTVLIGTSYSADPKWNFDGALRDALDADVLNLAERGRGPFAPMLAFLDQPPTADAPRRVVWEIPERYLPAAEPLRDPARVQLAHAPSMP